MNPIFRLLGIFGFALAAFGQTNLVRSPQLLDNKSAVFRLDAPNARQVSLFGDWMKTGATQALTKSEAGVWEVTLGPLPPGIYIYHFVVDGLTIADPVNPNVKLRARTSASLLEVPGSPDDFWELRDVPHGRVTINFHKAAALGGELREVWVYTPPGYEQHRFRRYPVLYLLHGSNDTPAGWTRVARANFTMDNLLAEGKAREMIIVTPFGHAQPFESRDRRNNELFEEYFLKDVMPMIESQYRVAKGRKNTAIAGFSMGGGHALRIGLGHLDKFSSLALLSPAVPGGFEQQFASVLQDPAGLNKKLDLFWIACGRDDFLFDSAKKFSGILSNRNIDHTYMATPGAHTFNVWRGYFHDFAPLLFQSHR